MSNYCVILNLDITNGVYYIHADALPNNGHYGINDMAMDAVADEDSDDGDDDDDDDTDGQLVINDDDATGDENNA